MTTTDVAAYLGHLTAAGRAPTTVRQVGYWLGRLQGYLRRPLREAGRADLTRFAGSLTALRPATRSAGLCYVARYYAWLERTGVILLSPATALARPRVRDDLDPRMVLAEADVAPLLAAPDALTPIGRRDRAVLEVLYGTGLRRQELVGLDLSDWLVAEGLVHALDDVVALPERLQGVGPSGDELPFTRRYPHRELQLLERRKAGDTGRA